MAAKDVVFGGEARARMVEGAQRLLKIEVQSVLGREPTNEIVVGLFILSRVVLFRIRAMKVESSVDL